MNPLQVFMAVWPIFLLIGLGYGLKKTSLLPDAGWRGVERFAVYVLYPGFLVPSIWHAPLGDTATLPMTLAVLGAVGLTILLGIGLKPVLTRFGFNLTNPSFSSVFQGLIRFNNFVFIPVIVALYGQEVLGLAVIAISLMIPLVNAACIIALMHWGEPADGKPYPRGVMGVLKTLMTNPIFASCVVGLALNILRVPPLLGVDKALKLLGEAAIPVGLILAGAGLSFAYARQRPVLITAISLYKLIALPLLGLILAQVFGADARAQAIVVGVCAAPSAAAGYVLARHMGGDAPLMAAVIALTTTLSVITMPLLLIGLGLGHL